MRFSLPLNLNELGKLARFDVRFYGVAQQRRAAWMGGACALHRFHGTEHPHIRSTLGPAHSGAQWARDVQGGACRGNLPSSRPGKQYYSTAT